MYQVLLINDNHELAHLGKSILQQKGFEVLSACNSEEVWVMLQHKDVDIDLILLDSRTTMLFNWQTLKMVRECEFSRQIPVIALKSQHYLNIEYFYRDCVAHIHNHAASTKKDPLKTIGIATGRRTINRDTEYNFIPNPDAIICDICLTRHAPDTPHCQDSLYYQCTFYAKYNRWPSWEDATAHCNATD